MRNCFTLVGVSLLVAAYAETARADSIQITSGTARIINDGGTFLTFSVAGTEFTAAGSWDLGFSDYLRTCSPSCVPGERVTLSTTVFNDELVNASIGELPAGGRVTHNGMLVNPPTGIVELLGTVSFATAALTLPAPPPGGFMFGGITVTLPFTLDGTVHVYNPFPLDPVRLFSVDLAGSGLATAQLPFNSTTNTYSPFFTLLYEFEAPAPVPEPALLLLLSSGLVGLVAARHRAKPGTPNHCDDGTTRDQ